MLTIIIGTPILLNKEKGWTPLIKTCVMVVILAFDAIMIYENLITHL